jgi:hypothetical protein
MDGVKISKESAKILAGIIHTVCHDFAQANLAEYRNFLEKERRVENTNNLQINSKRHRVSRRRNFQAAP